MDGLKVRHLESLRTDGAGATLGLSGRAIVTGGLDAARVNIFFLVLRNGLADFGLLR